MERRDAETKGLGIARLLPAYSCAARFYAAPIQGSNGFANRETKIAISLARGSIGCPPN